MSNDPFDKLIQELNPKPITHPRVLFLQSLLGMGYQIRDLMFYREESNLKELSDPVYFITLAKDSDIRQERFEWSSDVEKFLFEKGVKAIDKEQESSRGGHLLLRNLDWADTRWSRDYTNCVLYEFLSDLYQDSEEMQRLLSAFPFNNAADGRSKTECLEYLKTSFGGYANSLIVELGYASDDAKEIFLLAILKMFDERFHVSVLKILAPHRFTS